MKLFTLILMFVLLFSLQIYGQNCSDDIFEIEMISGDMSGTIINYYDKDREKFRHPPKFTSTVPTDHLVSVELISIQKKDSIERILFTTEELHLLNRGIVTFQIHVPSGKIASTSFHIKNEIDINKLKRMKDEFEKNLHFNVKLFAELEKEGYWIKSFPIFVPR